MELILLAGGVGKRMKQTIPKQLLLIGGKPIIIHTLERVDSIQAISKIIITTPAEYIDQLKNLVGKYKLKTPFIVIEGGGSRQESVKKGLEYVTSEHVMIHEAVRPFVLREEFEALIEMKDENVTLGLDIPFTVLEGKDKIEKILERSTLFNVQLPQKFSTKKLKIAHEFAEKEHKEFTEDASMIFYYLNEEVKVKKGTEYNIKVTTPIDMVIGEIIYKDFILGRSSV